ncbi:hypothetical protein CSUB01_02571 [Colletotrichum sublineola]|uniref:Uncharacterized protein n=1 Tax=Colletotrichum sublineola TaxID=1173701 RepID=A0A066X4D5_COLSU|nr:hypothetical protein CSUB01_02571 [Colletotrichum sublineola]
MLPQVSGRLGAAGASLDEERGWEDVLGSLSSLLGLDAGECRPAARRVCRRDLPAVPTLATETVGYAAGISDGRPDSQVDYTALCRDLTLWRDDEQLRYEEDLMVGLSSFDVGHIGSRSVQTTRYPRTHEATIAKLSGWFVRRLDRFVLWLRGWYEQAVSTISMCTH